MKELAGCGNAVAGERSRWAEERGTLGQAGNRRAGGGKQAVHSVREREQRSGHELRTWEVQCCSMRSRCSNYSCTF